MIPASLLDLRTIYYYNHTDCNGKNSLYQRNFYMELKTVGGVVLQSIKGIPVDNSKTKYFIFIKILRIMLDINFM